MARSLLVLVVLTAVFDQSSALQCYTRPSLGGGANGTLAGCASSCFSYVSYDGNQKAECAAACTSTTAGQCFSCNTDNCNPASPSSITCNTRSNSSVATIVTDCPYGLAACFYSNTNGASGCGACNSSATCTTCSSSLCNVPPTTTTTTNTTTQRTTAAAPVAPISLTCYYNPGLASSPKTATVRCSTTCYSQTYSAGSSTLYYNGCGKCEGTVYSNCVTCSTDLCNSASVLGISARLTAATAGIYILVLMKFLASAPRC